MPYAEAYVPDLTVISWMGTRREQAPALLMLTSHQRDAFGGGTMRTISNKNKSSIVPPKNRIAKPFPSTQDDLDDADDISPCITFHIRQMFRAG